MVDIFVALGASFVLAFVVAGPKARCAPESPRAKTPEAAKK